MSTESSAGQRSCEMCGNAVPLGAQYCPSCGARLVPQGESSRQSFEDAIASVLGSDEDSSPASPPAVSAAAYYEPFEPETANAPPLASQPPADAWSTSPRAEPSGWASYPPPTAQTGSGRSRTLWIVLAVFGFIVFCCCGLTFVSVAIASSDSATVEQVVRSLASL
jgi:hypothetical protein